MSERNKEKLSRTNADRRPPPIAGPVGLTRTSTSTGTGTGTASGEDGDVYHAQT